MQLTLSGEQEAPANDEGGTTGTTSGLHSAPSHVRIADMKQCIERVETQYIIWREAGMSQYREAQLKVLHGEEDGATAMKRATEVLQQQDGIMKWACAEMNVLITIYRRVIAEGNSLLQERVNEGAAEIQAIKARIDEKSKQMAAYDASSPEKGA